MGMFANVKPLQLPEGFHDKPKKKHGLAKGIAGTIGDYLMQQQGMAPVYAPTMARQREIEQAQQLYNQQRQGQMDDWVAREQWKLENAPPPESPFAKAEAYAALPDDQKANVASYYDMVNPQYDDVWTPQGMVRRQMHRAPQGPQKGHVEGGYEFMGGDPSDQNNWKPVGGPAGNGGGNFR